MKHTLFTPTGLLAVILLTFFLPRCTSTEKVDAVPLIRQMDKLLDKKEYFHLESQLNLHSRELSTSRRLYYAAILDNVFNRNASCIARIDSSLNLGPAGLPDSLKANLLLFQGDSYFKTGQYAAAALTDSLLAHQYAKAIDSPTLANAKNDWLIRNALRNEAPEEVISGAGGGVTWSRDSIGLIDIPLQSHTQTVNAIFDTRANISSITRSYAEKLHLHLMDVQYRESAGITGNTFTVGLGVADSLYIGRVLVRNAVFQVMPDSIFYIAPIHFQLNVILGLPIIADLQEVQLYTDGRMVIPPIPTPGDLHNMAFDGLDPIILLPSGDDTLLYHFDSGASSTTLYATYFDTHRSTILRSAIKRKTSFGGAGGTQTKDIYLLPSFQVSFGGKTVTLDSVSVLTEKITPGERFYGNVGQDFMRQFKEFTIDFRYMYIK
jgi:Aspartyl protease